MRKFVAIVLMLAGAGYLAWTYVGTNVVAHHHQDSARNAIVKTFESGMGDTKSSDVKVGNKSLKGVGLISIPAINLTDAPIAEGFTQEIIDSGLVGHIGVMPGEVGNVALIGHVVTHGEVFKRVDELTKGDAIVLKSSDGSFTYKVRTISTAKSSDTWTTLPVPSAKYTPGEKVNPVVTLVTCASRIARSDERIVVIGDLVKGSNR